MDRHGLKETLWIQFAYSLRWYLILAFFAWCIGAWVCWDALPARPAMELALDENSVFLEFSFDSRFAYIGEGRSMLEFEHGRGKFPFFRSISEIDIRQGTVRRVNLVREMFMVSFSKCNRTGLFEFRASDAGAYEQRFINLADGSDVISHKTLAGMKKPVSLSPDGRWVVGQSNDKKPMIIDTSTGMELDFRAIAELNEPPRWYWFSDNARILVAHGAKSLHFFDMDLREYLSSVTQDYEDSEYSPDNVLVAFIDRAHYVKLFDLRKGVWRTLQESPKCKRLQFSEDGKYLASYLRDGVNVPIVWNTETGVVETRFAKDSSASDTYADSMRKSIDGHLHTVEIENAQKICAQTFGNGGTTRSPDSSILMTYREETNAMITKCNEWLGRISPRLRFEVPAPETFVRLWNLKSGALSARFRSKCISDQWSDSWKSEFSPGSRYLAIISPNQYEYTPELKSSHLEIWDVEQKPPYLRIIAWSSIAPMLILAVGLLRQRRRMFSRAPMNVG